MKYLVLLGMLLPCFVSADLRVNLINESSLPYDYSPNNYDNSPNNYDNSINNYDNSPNNYDNSPNNYENSPNNYDNSISGHNRLIYNSSFVGYYVRTSNGVTNFYSPKGVRMFYNPPKTVAVFDGESGEFVGVIGNINNQLSLALTQYGNKVLGFSQ
ncbi:hypothetical protein [Haemophilus haemolyticus]|uniref:hypothetical protein n=1 Tax=Haemophilus haemolyticus TaxID=726 RepID=UPI000E572DB8|nr:hypothetical protein [Haemophilus haemolyticus]